MSVKLLGVIDRAIAWAFPKRLWPDSMFVDEYWLGIVSGMFVGVIATASAVSPKTNTGLGVLVAMAATVGVLRFITLRVDGDE